MFFSQNVFVNASVNGQELKTRFERYCECILCTYNLQYTENSECNKNPPPPRFAKLLKVACRVTRFPSLLFDLSNSFTINSSEVFIRCSLSDVGTADAGILVLNIDVAVASPANFTEYNRSYNFLA